MKTHQVMFTIAILAALVWFAQVSRISDLNCEAAALSARISEYNDITSGKNLTRMGKSFFDGLTFGAFAEEGIFTEYHRATRERDELNAAVASLQVRYEDAVAYRNGALIVGIIALGIGVSTRKPETKDAQDA